LPADDFGPEHNKEISKKDIFPAATDIVNELPAECSSKKTDDVNPENEKDDFVPEHNEEIRENDASSTATNIASDEFYNKQEKLLNDALKKNRSNFQAKGVDKAIEKFLTCLKGAKCSVEIQNAIECAVGTVCAYGTTCRDAINTSLNALETATLLLTNCNDTDELKSVINIAVLRVAINEAFQDIRLKLESRRHRGVLSRFGEILEANEVVNKMVMNYFSGKNVDRNYVAFGGCGNATFAYISQCFKLDGEDNQNAVTKYIIKNHLTKKFLLKTALFDPVIRALCSLDGTTSVPTIENMRVLWNEGGFKDYAFMHISGKSAENFDKFISARTSDNKRFLTNDSAVFADLTYEMSKNSDCEELYFTEEDQDDRKKIYKLYNGFIWGSDIDVMLSYFSPVWFIFKEKIVENMYDVLQTIAEGL
jgi:hypothetical protein